MRDEHLLGADFFDVEKHPEVTYQALSILEEGEENTFKGELSLIESSKAINIPFQVQIKDSVYHLIGEFKFDRVEYGMKNQKLAPDDVKIKFDLIIERD